MKRKNKAMPGRIQCNKCGQWFDPRTQSSSCRANLKHYPTVPVAMPEFRVETVEPSPQQKPFQSDLRLFWNEDALINSGINNNPPTPKRWRR